MKRVLLLTLDFPPRRGGVARYLCELCQYWQSRVFVIAPHEPGDKESDAKAPFTIKRRKLLFKYFWPRWTKAILVVLPELFRFNQLWVSHILPLGTVALFFRLIFRKEYLVFLHSMDFALATRNAQKSFLTKQILRHAKAVITNSDVLAERVRQFAGELEITVVYPCINPRLKIAAEGAFDQGHRDGVTLLTVSRLVGRKGHHQVLRAIALLADKRIRYYIVGSGMEYNSLIRHAQKLGVDKQVVFFGDVSDQELVDLYRGADIFVMPTEFKGPDIEGFGIVYLEAGVFGLPVIASNVPGVNEAVLNGRTGLLVEPENHEQVAGALKRLVDNEAERRQLGQASRERVLTEFLSDHQAQKLEPYL